MSKFSREGFNDSACESTDIFINIKRRLDMIARTRFVWEGLPPTMSERYLEWVLYHRGFAVFCSDKDRGHLSLSGLGCGMELDVYGNPTSVEAYGVGAYRAKFPVAWFKPTIDLGMNPAVIVRNNPDEVPTLEFVRMFARDLYNVQAAISCNVKQQKFPFLVLGDIDDRQALLNVYQQYEGNYPVIFGEKRLRDTTLLESINTNAPFVADKLTELKHDIFNEFLTFFGIRTSNIDKKERMVKNESESANHMAHLSVMAQLECRELAANLYNDIYGTEISVSLREYTQEGDEYGQVYNAVEARSTSNGERGVEI